MQVQIDIGFKQLIQIIRKLPPSQLSKIREEIEKEYKQDEVKFSDIETFLLKAPTFTKQQLDTIAETRKSINQWRKK